MKVIEVDLNEELLIARHSLEIDYCDVFQIKREIFDEIPQPKDCMIAFFKSFPPFFIRLLHFRESLAKIFGLKTVPKKAKYEIEKELNKFEGNIGDSIAIFEVIDKNDIELLTGQKDKHLDFILSFISYKKANCSIIELATTVNIHNFLGKTYFFFVRPIHRYYMKKIMKRMVKELENKSW